MSEIPDNSVQLVVTSPPYWQLKDYGARKQIGYHQSYEEYIASLNSVWAECIRVLEDGCRLCVNIGDQFARSAYYGRYKVIPIRTEIIRYCESNGLDYMGAVIWQKVTTTHTTGGGSVMGSFPYPRNGILKLDYEFILVFKKPGKGGTVSKETKQRSRMTTEEWNRFFAGHWNFPGERQSDHIAAFPVELPSRLIRMFTFVGDTVLDPFLGSGTTSLAAGVLGRNSIGYEINRRFMPVIRKRLSPLAHQKIDFRSAERRPERKLRHDPRPTNGIKRRAGTASLRFGSAVTKEDRAKERRSLKVTEILSPSSVRLNDGSKVQLMGIVENPALRREAMEFLEEKTVGKEVFLKGERTVDDTSPRSYLYLRNKTFVNAHLVRSGLVDVDTTRAYRHREKFLSLAGSKAPPRNRQ